VAAEKGRPDSDHTEYSVVHMAYYTDSVALHNEQNTVPDTAERTVSLPYDSASTSAGSATL